ncbi:MAG: hypothetical protein IKX67_07170 [Bacteroidales bacterium]|nr:hypothetical protein [Bacteroidales bacterium]
MTVRQFVSQQVGKFGITPLDADLLEMQLKTGLDAEELVTGSNMRTVAQGLALVIRRTIRPKSVSEGGVSVSYDNKDLLDFYAQLCKDYGIKDELNKKPKVTFL